LAARPEIRIDAAHRPGVPILPNIGHGGAPFAVGTSATVAGMLRACSDQRLSHLVLTFHAPGMASAAVRRSMRAFARDIMPVIAAW
jgi:hypothetical protein